MSKKRLRTTPSLPRASEPAVSKQDPKYWQRRLFKCRYTYKGKQIEVRNWSVKIQHQGKRKTFSLRSSRRRQAAGEACELYRALVNEGWEGDALRGSRGQTRTNPLHSGGGLAGPDKLDPAYWAQRLIQRPYAMRLQPPAHPDFSVRIEHGGIGHYFPLGTDKPGAATKRALQIYQTIAGQGWKTANQRFSRELTVAFRWLDVPLAWTYTTIHTQNTVSRNAPTTTQNGSLAIFEVAVAESDGGIRRALEWCLNHMEGVRCTATFSSAAEALRESSRRPIHLVLVSHSLADMPGTVCLSEMKAVAPAVSGLLYSVYEDSEELFRATPGGAGTYLLRRTPPTHILEAIAGLLKQGRLFGEDMAAAAWQYFKESFSSTTIGSSARQLASLTQREHEVLGLLSKGHPDKDIADRLGISIHTVHEHVKNIFDKLGVHNRTEAVVKFLQK